MMTILKIAKKTDPGIFVDLAAAFPQYASNSFILEQCFGWRGICIEGDREKTPILADQRACTLITNCVADKIQTVEFLSQLDSGSSGINDVTTLSDNTKQYHKYKVQCLPLPMLLAKHDVTHVDFMSLDIEGAEGMALEGMRSSSIKIDVLVIEVEHCCKEDSPKTQPARASAMAFLKENDYLPMVGSIYSGIPAGHCDNGKPTAIDLTGFSLEELFANQMGGAWDVFFVRKDSIYYEPFQQFATCKYSL